MHCLISRMILTCCLLGLLAVPVLAAELPESTARLAVSAAQALADSRLTGIQAALAGLAATDAAQDADWNTVQPLLATLQGYCPPCALWFSLPDGTYYTADKGLMGQSLADRKYFPRLLEGELVLGDVVVSKSTNQIAIIVAVPVMRDGALVGALGGSVFAAELADSIAQGLELPAGTRMLMLDANGALVSPIPFTGADWADQQLEYDPAAGELRLSADSAPVAVIQQQSSLSGLRFLVLTEE